jgi:hypothetical protein
MAKSKRQTTITAKKKMQKEIRTGNHGKLSAEMSAYQDELTKKEMSKKFPKKESSKKALAIPPKKKPHSKKVSKRTTPGSVPDTSTPAHVHPEGSRWAKTIVKQNLNKQKTLSRRLSKRK